MDGIGCLHGAGQTARMSEQPNFACAVGRFSLPRWLLQRCAAQQGLPRRQRLGTRPWRRGPSLWQHPHRRLLLWLSRPMIGQFENERSASLLWLLFLLQRSSHCLSCSSGHPTAIFVTAVFPPLVMFQRSSNRYSCCSSLPTSCHVAAVFQPLFGLCFCCLFYSSGPPTAFCCFALSVFM